MMGMENGEGCCSTHQDVLDGQMSTVCEEEHRGNGNYIKHANRRSYLHSIVELGRLEAYLQMMKKSMAVFGLFYTQTDTHEPVRESRRFKDYFHASVVYSCLVLVLMWANFLRYILSFWVGNIDQSLDVFRVVPTVWTFHVCMNATILVKASHPRSGYQTKLCEYWRGTIVTKLADLKIEQNTSAMRRNLGIGLGLAWTCVSVNFAAVAALFFLPLGSMSEAMREVLVSPVPINTGSKIVMLVCHLFNTVAWILPMLYFVAISTIMKSAFMLCRSAVQKTINEQPDHYPSKLRDLRVLHLSICKAVEIVDSDTKFLFANWYAANIPMACYLLNFLLQSSWETSITWLHFFWFTSSIVSMLLVSYFAASLHDTAHSPLIDLYEVSMRGVSTEELGQVQLFLSQLTSRSTGFTVMNLIVITKELLLTVAGLYLTYFVVLLQF